MVRVPRSLLEELGDNEAEPHETEGQVTKLENFHTETTDECSE